MGQGTRLDPFVLDVSKAYAAIRHVVESHRARNARVFGSVLRGQDTDNSGLDILVGPTPETTLLSTNGILEPGLGVFAAVAFANGFIVATRDASLFEAAGLKVINPWEAAQ